MGLITREEIFPVAQEIFFKVLTNYVAYPSFVDGVSGIRVLERSRPNCVQVEFSTNLMKKLTYVLLMEEDQPRELKWQLVAGDVFKKNSGQWQLTALGPEQTKVNYQLEVEFKGFVPSMITNKLVGQNLPAMLQSYYRQAQKLAAGVAP